MFKYCHMCYIFNLLITLCNHLGKVNTDCGSFASGIFADQRVM